MKCVLTSLQSSTRVKNHREVNARNKHTLTQTQIMVLTSSSPCLRKLGAAPTWYPSLKDLMCHLAWGRSLTAPAAHRRSRRWTCNCQRPLSTISTCTSRGQRNSAMPRTAGHWTAHTAPNCRGQGSCGEDERQGARNIKCKACTSYGKVWTHVYDVKEELVSHNAFTKHAYDMYIYSHTIIKHTPQCVPHTWCTNKSNAYILKHTPQAFCLNVFHVNVSTPMYVYLPQGAQSEDWDRHRWQLVVSKAKVPVGKREETVRLTLFRHRSAFRVCLSACARVSMCVCAYLKKQPRQSSTHTTTVIDMQMQGICIYAGINFIWKRPNNVYALNEVLVPHNAFAKHASDMYIYSHTNIKHTNIKHNHKTHTAIRSTHNVKTNQTHMRSNTHLNTDVKSIQTHIWYTYNEVICLNVNHVKLS